MMSKTLKELLEARFVSSGAFKISASGRKIRRRIKIGDDDYNKEDDIDKDGDVDKDDAKLAKRLRWESFSAFNESKVPERMQGKQKPYVSSDGKGNFEVLGNKGQTKATFNRSEHGSLAHGKAQAHLRSKYDEYMKEETLDELTLHYNADDANNKVKGRYDVDVKESTDKGEYDYEGQMARTQLQTIVRNATDLVNMLEDDENMPEWVQSKITLAQDYITCVRDYLQSKEELGEETELKGSILEHDEHGPDHVEIALDHRTPPKNQKAAMATLKAHDAEYVATSDKATHFKVHKDKAYRLSKELKTHGVSSDIMENKEEDPPFDKPYTTVKPSEKDKSGAVHGPMSRARHLARLAMKQAAKKAKA